MQHGDTERLGEIGVPENPVFEIRPQHTADIIPPGPVFVDNGVNCARLPHIDSLDPEALLGQKAQDGAARQNPPVDLPRHAEKQILRHMNPACRRVQANEQIALRFAERLQCLPQRRSPVLIGDGEFDGCAAGPDEVEQIFPVYRVNPVVERNSVAHLEISLKRIP